MDTECFWLLLIRWFPSSRHFLWWPYLVYRSLTNLFVCFVCFSPLCSTHHCSQDRTSLPSLLLVCPHLQPSPFLWSRLGCPMVTPLRKSLRVSPWMRPWPTTHWHLWLPPRLPSVSSKVLVPALILTLFLQGMRPCPFHFLLLPLSTKELNWIVETILIIV